MHEPVVDLVRRLRENGYTFVERSGELRVTPPRGCCVTPKDLERLANNKQDVFAYLRNVKTLRERWEILPESELPADQASLLKFIETAARDVPDVDFWLSTYTSDDCWAWLATWAENLLRALDRMNWKGKKTQEGAALVNRSVWRALQQLEYLNMPPSGPLIELVGRQLGVKLKLRKEPQRLAKVRAYRVLHPSYSRKRMAGETGVNIETIRYWERSGKLQKGC